MVLKTLEQPREQLSNSDTLVFPATLHHLLLLHKGEAKHWDNFPKEPAVVHSGRQILKRMQHKDHQFETSLGYNFRKDIDTSIAL